MSKYANMHWNETYTFAYKIVDLQIVTCVHKIVETFLFCNLQQPKTLKLTNLNACNCNISRKILLSFIQLHACFWNGTWNENFTKQNLEKGKILSNFVFFICIKLHFINLIMLDMWGRIWNQTRILLFVFYVSEVRWMSRWREIDSNN